VLPGIAISELHKNYVSGPLWRRKTTRAVRDLSLQVPQGEITGLLGANGAGKTTTVKILAGLIIPDQGTVAFPASQPATRIGAVLEGSRNLYWRLSAYENIEYFGALKGLGGPALRKQAESLLELFKLSEHRDKPAQALSRGMQQKLAIVLALLGEPQVLLLDEPTLGLDVESSLAIQDLLRRQCAELGLTILLTTHQMEVARALCRSVAIMREGQVALHRGLDELIDLFRRQDYTARLRLDDWQRAAAALQPYTAEVGPSQEGQLTVRFALSDPGQLYSLMSELERAQVSLLDFRQVEPTLEEVFLSVARGDPEPAAAQAGPAQGGRG